MKYLKSWLPWAALITGLCALVFVTVHQQIRQEANDLQVQIVEDAAVALQSGQLPEQLVPAAKVDISKSLAPFIIFYDDGKVPVAGSGELNGKTPTPPSGVFDFTREHGQDRITWQPQPDTRIAMVMVHYGGEKSGFVLAGRNLREVEHRAKVLGMQVAAAWLGFLVLSAGLVFVAHKPKLHA